MRILFLVLFATAIMAQAEEKQAPAGDAEKTEEIKKENGERVVRTTHKDGMVTEKIFDRFGNLIIKKDKNGNAWLYTYDQANRCIREEKPDGAVILYEFKDPTSKVPSRVRILKPDGSEDTSFNKAG